MSFAYRDILGPALAKLNSYNKLFRAFDGSSQSEYNKAIRAGKTPRFHNGVWKTHWIGDVEVYNGKLKFYRDGFVIDKLIERFVKALGLDWGEFTSQDVDSKVDDMWFYFKKGFIWDGSVRGEQPPHPVAVNRYEPTLGYTTPSKEQIAEAFNKTFEIDEEVKVTITYGGSFKRYSTLHSEEWEATGVEIVSKGFNSSIVIAKILSNPWFYIANTRHKPYTKDIQQFQAYDAGLYDMPKKDTRRPTNRNTPTASASAEPVDYDPGVIIENDNYNLAVSALFDNGVVWEPKLNEDGSIRVYNETTVSKGSSEAANVHDGIVTTHTIELRFIYKGCDIYSGVVEEAEEWLNSIYQDITKISKKLSTVDRYKDDLINSTIDTPYKKALWRVMEESNDITLASTNSLYYGGHLRVNAIQDMKRKDFARLVATKLDQDYDLDKSGSGTFSKIFTAILIILAVVVFVMTLGSGAPISQALLYSSLVLTGGMMAASLLKLPVRQSEMKLIGDVATVTGIASMAAGVYNAWQVAKSDLAKQAAIEGSKQQAQASAIDIAIQMVKNAFNGMAMTISQKIKLASDAISKYTEYRGEKEAEEFEKSYEERLTELDDLNTQNLVAEESKLEADWYIEARHSDIERDMITSLEQYKTTNHANGIQNEIVARKDICLEVPMDIGQKVI